MFKNPGTFALGYCSTLVVQGENLVLYRFVFQWKVTSVHIHFDTFLFIFLLFFFLFKILGYVLMLDKVGFCIPLSRARCPFDLTARGGLCHSPERFLNPPYKYKSNHVSLFQLKIESPLVMFRKTSWRSSHINSSRLCKSVRIVGKSSLISVRELFSVRVDLMDFKYSNVSFAPAAKETG